jgi:hypothetical protein
MEKFIYHTISSPSLNLSCFARPLKESTNAELLLYKRFFFVPLQAPPAFSVQQKCITPEFSSESIVLTKDTFEFAN